MKLLKHADYWLDSIETTSYKVGQILDVAETELSSETELTV